MPVVVAVVEIFVHSAVKATVTNAPQSQLNKWVFNSFLNWPTVVSDWRSEAGRLFQSLGPATWKARSPKPVWVRGTTQVCWVVCIIAHVCLCVVMMCMRAVDQLTPAGNPANAIHRSLAAYGSVPAMPLPPVNPAAQNLVAAQQQELLYRELLSRAPYVTDPALTQQVSKLTHTHTCCYFCYC